MGLPKIKKASDLREDLYKTLDRVLQGEKHIVPTKEGDVMLISKIEYDALVDDLELLKAFDPPIIESELLDNESVLNRLEKKYGFGDENKVVKKRRKKS